MKTKLFFIFLLSLSLKSICQTSNDRDIGSIAVLIQTSVGSGSGFYIQDTSKHFVCLVTACHVLIDQKQNIPYCDSILLISYKKNSQKDNRDSFKISLFSAYKMGLFRYDINKDVAVLIFSTVKNRVISYFPFVRKLTNTSTYINSIEITVGKKINELITMAHIYTIGYPKSLTLNINFDYNRPLIRGGIISGVDLIKNKIIIDCPTYQGNSGGMVFESEVTSDTIYLIGLVSQFVPFEEHWINEAYGYFNTNVYNSGYTVVVPFDAIKEQLDLITK
jgi:hypothetical protein